MDKMRSSVAFTMLELMVVIVIIGILAAMSFTHFNAAKESAYDKEVMANLKLIASAEKIYRMETGAYFPTNSHSALNSELRLMLPNNGPRPWNYTVATNAANTTFIANGTRTSGAQIRVYHMNDTDEEPHL
jgi:prepilin-type N-terminal cleavage/methylation domain-containing protein